jgi:hypothetical protein
LEVSVQLHVLVALLPEKEPPVSIEYEVVWPQSRFGYCRETNIYSSVVQLEATHYIDKPIRLSVKKKKKKYRY